MIISLSTVEARSENKKGEFHCGVKIRSLVVVHILPPSVSLAEEECCIHTFISEEIVQGDGAIRTSEAALVPSQVLVRGLGESDGHSTLISCTGRRREAVGNTTQHGSRVSTEDEYDHVQVRLFTQCPVKRDSFLCDVRRCHPVAVICFSQVYMRSGVFFLVRKLRKNE